MSQASALEQYMLELVNQERSAVGAPPLQFNSDLNESSEDHSAWMNSSGTFSHTGQAGSSVGDRIVAAGYELEGTWGYAENIAWQSERGAAGFEDDVFDLHVGLMNSPGHRANILNPDFEEIGIGIEIGNFNNSFGVMITQNFGTTDATPDPQPTPAPAPAPEPVNPAPAPTGPIASQSGTPDNDILLGTSGNDALFGLGGADSLTGGDGNDILGAGSGNDTADAGPGADSIGGGTGDDLLSGGTGNDTMGGGIGNDTMSGDAGDDIVNGGADNDNIAGNAGNDTMGGGFGDDVVNGNAGDDMLGGGAGQDTVHGGDGHDVIGGGEGDDIITGGAGNDFLAGGGRDDRLDGGAGADRINSGAGNDTITGGSGADIFIFNEFDTGETDTITDFQDGVDMIRLFNIPGSGASGKLSALDISNGSGGANISYNGHTITLEGVSAADLTAEDFIFV